MSDKRKVTDGIDLITEALEVFSVPVAGQDSFFKDKVMVDVGCGAGHLARELTSRGARVTGIDTPEMVKKAQEYTATGDETYQEGGGECLPLENDWADVVIFFASLHHIEVDKMREALKECYRVLKKNGLAIIVEPVIVKGTWSELAKLLRDETEIQKQALATIKSADQIGFMALKEESFYFERTLDDFITQLNDHEADENKRKEYIRAGEKILADFSSKAHIATADYRFKSNCRLNILQKK